MSERKIVLTGDRPTGPLHLGHYVGSLQNRVSLQESSEQFVMLADIQALTDNMERVGKIRESMREVLLDYLAVGIEPTKTCIFVQSGVPALAELTVHLLNITSFERVKRNPTVKQEITERNYGANATAGFIIYPVSQAADILAFKTDVVPAGADQLPMIELSNEIARRFNRLFDAEVLKTSEALVPDMGRLPGIDGKSKMGKSLKNAIYLKDSPKEISRKIRQMYTDPNHLRVEDPGTVEGNVVFTYLDAFDPDTEGVENLKADYRRGGVGDGMVKKRLEGVLNDMLTPIRRRREHFESDPAELDSLLEKGTAHAASVAADTLKRVRHAMGIDYF